MYTHVENLSIWSTLNGQPAAKKRRHDKKIPSINVLMNSTLGAKQPVLVTALLDSGGSECLINEKAAKKLRIRTDEKQVWRTAAGTFSTRGRTKVKFKFLELREQSLIEWDMHVTPNDMHYDMIIGRDLLTELGIKLDFDNLCIEWKGSEVPMRSIDDNIKKTFFVKDSSSLDEATERIKWILEAKYEPANIDEEIKQCDYLDEIK